MLKMIRQIFLRFNSVPQRILLLLSLLMSSFAQEAYSSEIDTIDVYVKLDRQGTAYISEYWDVYVDDSNSEWYISLKNMGDMRVSDLQVYDYETQSYFADDTPWDVNRSRIAKKGLSGINRLDGNDCELCWGVGSSGRHAWVAMYKVEGFVKEYQDGAGFNHCFVNYGLSAEPRFVRTTIVMADSTPLSYENARIWAFQYPGYCQFDAGAIVAWNSESFTTDNSMVVMSIFPKGMFNSSIVVDDTIGTMKWKALEGSDYLGDYSEEDYAEGRNVLFQNGNALPWWEELLITLAVVVGGIFVYAIGYGLVGLGFYLGIALIWNIISLRPLRIYHRRKKLLEGAESPYFRGVPINGNLNRSFYLIDENNYRVYPIDKDNLYAAYLVRLMRYGALSVTSTEEKGKLVNRLKVVENFNFSPSGNVADDKALEFLYHTIKNASGANLILEKGELKSYLEKRKVDCLTLETIVKAEDSSDAKPKEFQDLVGLENFLKDFTLMNTRDAVEVELWDEYLVYATLYGIADQVLKSFKEACPEYFKLSKLGSQLINESGTVISDFNSFTGISRISRGLSSSSGSRSSGGGGHSSGGGGGGHSGGGGGGGGR